MTEKEQADKITNALYNKDTYSKWLGIECLESGAGKSVLRLLVREEMLNGFGIAHGGITYSLADSALAFASNSHGFKAVSIETSISHIEKVVEGDVLTAVASEESRTRKIGIYSVEVQNQSGKRVALFKGMVYYTGATWEV